MFLKNQKSRIDPAPLPAFKHKGIHVDVLREDELHDFISGNKYRKLKFNLEKAKDLRKDTLVTFGGAYSNHIAATAAAGSQFGFKTVGIIRGDELANYSKEQIDENPTLRFAIAHGMQLEFISRTEYRNKNSEEFLKRIAKKFNNSYIVPEGGTNDLAIKGCQEILTEECMDYDIICVAVGTGGTISGLINSAQPSQTVIGFPALKGDFLHNEIKHYVIRTKNWSLNTTYHFGGYGKISEELIRFINKFKEFTGIPLDPVYTGKMMFGIGDLISKDYFKSGTKILAIHTGGLQGITGMNKVLKKKKWDLIQ